MRRRRFDFGSRAVRQGDRCRIAGECWLSLCVAVLGFLPGCSDSPSSETMAGPTVRVEFDSLGYMFPEGGELYRLRLHGPDVTNRILSMEFAMYATRNGESTPLLHGWMTDRNDESFDASVYYMALTSSTGEGNARSTQFGITAHADDGHSWTDLPGKLAVELANHKLSNEFYPFPRVTMSTEVVIVNALAIPLEPVGDESVEEYRQQHTQVARLPLPPPPFGSGGTAMVPNAHYGLHDLEKVREHTRKTPDLVVSVAVRLLSQGDVARAEQTTSACLLALRLLTAHLRTHHGKWPSSWHDLEKLSVPDSGDFSWPDDAEQVKTYVRIDFSADPDELWKRPIEELDVLEPIGVHKPYTLTREFEQLFEALGETRTTQTL